MILASIGYAERCLLLADIVAKVTAGNLKNRNAQQSNRDEWIFESALRMRA